ncbi:MAG: branched-chain amino acid ABC transporter permease [Chloroflexi bacterium]|nr:branched-chain amino acid ABC transporter permease [Chloroflexota bacterium]MCI0646005.1 branched-chain amino acid ABC transporter permease [Chloroflexota bacterium]MCI0726846.1 branched-chain amino acid ABC transporter permease [Chloroflexota bacterium]
MSEIAGQREVGVLLMKPPEIALRRAAEIGALGGLAAVFVSITGMVTTFAGRHIIYPVLTMGYMLLLFIPLVTSYLAARPPKPIEGQPPAEIDSRNVVAGLVAGAAAGLVTVLLVVLLSLFNQERLRAILINVSPAMYDLVSLGQGLGVGLSLLVVIFAALGALGGALHLVPQQWSRPVSRTLTWVLGFGILSDVITQILTATGQRIGLSLRPVAQILFRSGGGLTPVGAVIVTVLAFAIAWYVNQRGNQIHARINSLPAEERRRLAIAGYIALAALILLSPFAIGPFLSSVLDLVGIFAIMALGLNIVLGYAGMLDLGYVAFFAVGAYTTAVLTSPQTPACVAGSFCPQVSFWAALLVGMVMATIAGIIVGTPVIRMRGDYLAIVTLGFGEIARLIIQSDWFKPVLGAAQGIIRIPSIAIGPFQLADPPEVFYPVLALVLLSVYALWRLQSSRVGRAWMALREDERVAEVMGINIVTTKLMAFITGAILASFAGALFATYIRSVFPHSFSIEKSIQVLIIVIIGGLGSIPGMVAGAFLIVGMPELLREFDEYKFLVYGVVLMIMMLYRPEGLIPNRRIAHVLTDEEGSQDAWLKAQTTGGEQKVQSSEQ